MKNIRKKIKRISAGAATGLIIMLIPLALSAQQTWRAARGFSQPEKTGQVKVRKTASTATSLTFEYSLPSASFKNGSTITSAGQIEVGSTPQRQRAGEPNIPVIPVQVVLPAGTTLEKAVVTTDNSEEIAGSHRIEHGQKPVPLNGKGSRTVTSADAKIYGSDAPYPAGLVEVVGIQKKRGVTIALLNIFPVTYHPQSGKIIIFKTLTLKVITKPLTGKSGTVRVPSVQEQFFPSVENPEELDSYRKGADIAGGEIQPLGICNPSDSYRYVIVTADSFATATTDVTVRDLIAQKQARGISATIVTIENVKAGYTGVDDAERLRNFIIDAYSNWETEFVLLGGDINIIPLRKLYCNGGGEIDQIPSDLYYQCLDGNYNSDNDSYWGETTDGPGGSDVDLMAEVFIGRASAETRVEMSNFVYKTLAYENATESSPYLRKAMMVGEELGFGGVSEYATATMEEIRLGSSEHGYTTAGFASSTLFTVDTLYDRSGYSWTSSEIISRMNSNNFGIFNHLGHANATYVMKFYNADADALTNTNPFFAYSQGCIPGNFEVDCIAEHLTTSHRRGAFAVVFNARYGWGQFNSTDGPSQRFDRQFWDAYFSEYMINLGALNADSHEDNLWDINGDCIRWCYYETNLLGDPQTPIRGLVNGPMVQYNSHIFNDNAGNGDGLINPGERIVVLPTLANVGSESAAGVTMTLSTSDSYIAMVDNSASAGTIACCGAVQQALDNMVFNVASNCPTPHTVPFTLTTRDNNGGEWTAQFSMTVYTSSQVSGYVRASASGAALPNATVSFSGPLSGTVTTDASGRYLFGGINGTYSITAVASGYLQSSPLTVILPPAQTNVDFNLVRPRMGLTPGSMHVEVPSGGSGTRTLTVSNSGDAALSFSIASRDMTGTNVLPAEVLYSSEHFAMQTKGMTDRRIGKPVVLGRGGPDQFGYRWTDSDESGGPSYQWTDIRNTGTLLSTITGCDDCYQLQALSFQFPFYGNTFSTIYVSSNGYITFGSGNSNYGNYALPSTSMPSNLIAAYFDDLYPGSSGDIYFQDFGNKAIVQFTDVAPYSGSGSLTFQTVIEQNGSIYFYYNTMTGTLTSTTAGIQNSTQNDGLTVVYNAAYLKNNLAVRLRPVPDWLTVTPESGTVPAGGSNSLTVQFSSEGLNGGFNYGGLEFTHNDPAQITPYLFPCTLYVDGMRRIAVNPSTINFGNNQIGSYDTVLITLTNSGDEPTTVSGITSSASQFTHNVSLPLTVPSFGSVPIRAIYHPLIIGNHTGTLSIISNAEDNPSINIPMSGAGVPAPDVAVTPVSFSKILSAGSSATDILTINNTGGDVLTYSISIADVATSSRVAKARNSSDSTIENGLRLPPDFVMPQSNGNLAVTYPFFDGFESGNWNNWSAGTGSYTRSVTNATAASGSYSFTLTGGNSEHFDGVSAQFASEQSPTEVSFAVRTNDPNGASGYFVLGPTGSCPIFFFMAPEGVFYVNDYTTVTYQPNVWYRIRYLIDWTAHTFDLYIDGTLITSDIAFRDAVNSINTVYLYNYYSAQAWWDNINIGGAPASDWLTVSPITGSVASGAAAQVQVGFNSANMNGGTYQKEIRITTNVPGRESVVVPVSMTVDGMPRLSATPLQYTYPPVWNGGTANSVITLINDGNEPTTVSSITSSNSVFAAAGSVPVIVPAYGSVTLNVGFTPIAVGSYSGTISLTSNAEDNPVLQVSLTGTCVNGPDIAVTPGSINVSLAPDATATRTMNIRNNGGANLNFEIQFRATGVQNTGSHDILIINDGSTGPTLDTLLTNAGYNVTMVSDDAVYNGTNPSLDGFAAVVLTDGTDYGDDMPAAGQTAIANYVNNGGGLVTLEWIGYEIENGRYSTLAPLIPFIRTSGSSGTETYSISSTHPVTEGLSGSFTLSTGTSIGVVAGTGCLGVVTGSVAGAAVVVAERGEGKVVSFASSGNYDTYRPFGNQNLRRLFTNAVGWVAQSTPSWLTLGISEGEVIPGNSTDVLLTFNSTGLAAGTYGGELAVQHNSPLDVNPMIIPVTLVVNENGGGYISAVTSIGISALVKAQGTRYSLSGITLGAPVTGTLQGNRYRLSLW
jgi:hypothetical protein